MSLAIEDKETLRKTITTLLKDVSDDDSKEISITTHGNYCVIQHTDKHDRTSGISCYLTNDYDYGTLLSEFDIILNPMLFQQKCLLNPKLSRL